MKKSLYVFISAALWLAATAASAAPDSWKVVFLTSELSDTHTGVEFHKNGKKAFSIKFDAPHRIGFMVPLNRDPDMKHRFVFSGVYDSKNFKYQDHLIDIKGDGDRRYLLLTNWSGANHGSYAPGYLIDTKDDFTIIGRVPTGEVYDYPMPNRELIFTCYEDVEYFGTLPAAIFIQYKLRKNKPPLQVTKAGDISTFSLDSFKKLLEDKNWSLSRTYTLAKLYCDLASYGMIKQFPQYAHLLGYDNKEIAAARKHYGKKLRKCKLYKHIRNLNSSL
jgi:hypothetical protein